MAVYACADLHGKYDLYEQICLFLKPKDTVYFLGDAGDRGPDSWKLIKAVYNNPHFIYMKGNHEDLFVRAAAQIDFNGVYGEDYTLLCQNGGENTIIDWEKETDRSYWVKKINNLPAYLKYQNEQGVIVCLSHAGFTPKLNCKSISENDLLWDRTHYLDNKWDERNFSNVIIIHGHTPIPFIKKDREHKPLELTNLGTYWYCNNHKVCIDNGSVWTNTVCLLDLNTFDEHIFTI